MIVFDAEFYQNQNPDVFQAYLVIGAGSGQTWEAFAETHYFSVGWTEGRNPSPYFDADYYLCANPDLATAVDAGLIQPFEHFNEFGYAEGRAFNLYIDIDFYLQENLDIAAVAAQGLLDPLEHFTSVGDAEGRTSSPFFDPSYYLQAYPEVASAGIAPLQHFLTEGAFLFYSPNANMAQQLESGFDAAAYAAANPELAAEGIVTGSQLYAHWVLMGAFKGLQGAQNGDGEALELIESSAVLDTEVPVVQEDQAFSYAEGQPEGFLVGSVAASDNEAVASYEITAGSDEGFFAIDAITGQISLTTAGAAAAAASNDFETGPNSFTLTVQAADAAGNSGSGTVTVNVTDVDDEDPVVAPDQSFSYQEGQPAGFLVGSVAASDNEAVTSYEITAGNDDGFFRIDAATGQITLTAAGAAAAAASNDFETGPNLFSLTVQAADAAGNSGSGLVTVSVTDIDDEDPVVAPDQIFSYAEGQADGFLVGSVNASDNEAVTSYEITAGNDDGFFAIDASTGQITLTAAGAAAAAASNDFETGSNSFSLTVQAADAAGNSGSGTVTVSVTDVDDEDPVVAADQTFSYQEGQPAGFLVGSVIASDNEAVTSYEITAGNDDGFFRIDAATGQIALTTAGAAAAAASNDFETGPNSFSLTVQ
ncbi:MAG: cadherin repeat domain-containing protein, partial [Pseudomonadota bacterium]